MIIGSVIKKMWLFWVIGLVCVFMGCNKTASEKNAGIYQIESYTYHGQDSMAQLRRFNMDGEFRLKDDNSFSIVKHTGIENTLGDSLYYYGGSYQYLGNETEIVFKAYDVAITVFTGQTYDFVYSSYAHTGSFQPPLFFEGNWYVEREGKKSLHLERATDKHIKLHLRRKNVE